MWFKISQLKVGLDFSEANLPRRLASEAGLPLGAVQGFTILRKSLDARHKKLCFSYTLIFELDSAAAAQFAANLDANPNISAYLPRPAFPIKPIVKRAQQLKPVIVGAGPAGLFAGLRLALAGLRPLIIERGEALGERIGKVNAFWNEGQLDPESNIQFGIGGAGTFSDGKLTTRSKDPDASEILATIVKLGGPPEIAYWQYPHLGTDLLRQIVTNLQALITEHGGEFRFGCRLVDFELKNGQLESLRTGDGAKMEARLLVLATGNSARDVYRLLAQKKLPLVSKPFAIGLRIEHPQDLIDRAQYGGYAGHPKLGPAEYRLTYTDEEQGRGVYTFCMCPGGMVIGATSACEAVVTNGMSYQRRDSNVANAAVVVTVFPSDFSEPGDPLSGMKWQAELENRAFRSGGGAYRAPVQRLADFMKHEPTREFLALQPSYRPGYRPANLWEILPPAIAKSLASGIKYFATALKGFDWPDAVLTGIETRTSAPVRIMRNQVREMEGVAGIYPVGEGAGWAGGIVSSALDGWKTAVAIVERVDG